MSKLQNIEKWLLRKLVIEVVYVYVTNQAYSKPQKGHKFRVSLIRLGQILWGYVRSVYHLYLVLVACNKVRSSWVII